MNTQQDDLLNRLTAIQTVLNQLATPDIRITAVQINAIQSEIEQLTSAIRELKLDEIAVEFYDLVSVLTQQITDIRLSNHYQVYLLSTPIPTYLDHFNQLLSNIIMEHQAVGSFLAQATPLNSPLSDLVEQMITDKELVAHPKLTEALDQVKNLHGKISVMLTGAEILQEQGEQAVAAMDQSALSNNGIIDPRLSEQALKITEAIFAINAATTLLADQNTAASIYLEQLIDEQRSIKH